MILTQRIKACEWFIVLWFLKEFIQIYISIIFIFQFSFLVSSGVSFWVETLTVYKLFYTLLWSFGKEVKNDRKLSGEPQTSSTKNLIVFSEGKYISKKLYYQKWIIFNSVS